MTCADVAIISRQVSASPERVGGWIAVRPHGEYTLYDIRLIVAAYFRIAPTVGIDPVWAVAQMAHETDTLASWWAARPRRNPAGIGVTGEAGVGVFFPSWERHAIPAHLGRLVAYAVPRCAWTEDQRVLAAFALNVRPLDEGLVGSAPSWRDLGGTWAPSAEYGERIAAIAQGIVG